MLLIIYKLFLFLKRLTKTLPYIECTKLEIAEGIAVAGFIKFSLANTTPRPEFCIPTSMEIVLLMVLFLVSM